MACPVRRLTFRMAFLTRTESPSGTTIGVRQVGQRSSPVAASAGMVSANIPMSIKNVKNGV